VSILRLACCQKAPPGGRPSHTVPAERDRTAALHDDTCREFYVKHFRNPEINVSKAFWLATPFRHG